MRHSLKVSVSKEPQIGGVVTCRNIGIREKLLRFFFGAKRRVTILIPGDSVEELAICDMAKEGGEKGHEQ